MFKSCRVAAATGLLVVAGVAQAQSYEYRALTVGDPGVPGDGVYTTARYDGEHQPLSPFYSLAGVTDGFTITVFPDPASPPINVGGKYDGVEFFFVTPDNTCYLGVWEPFVGVTEVNGVTGGYAYISQERLNQIVDNAHQYCSQAGDVTVQDLAYNEYAALASIPGAGENDWPVYTFYNTLDALAFGHGPDGHPPATTAPTTVSVQSADVTQYEGEPTLLTVQLTRPAAADVTVPLNWSGSATRGVDYDAPDSVTIPAGTMVASVQIETHTDGIDEPDEAAVLTLGTPGNVELGPDTSFTLTIADIDAPPVVSFTTTSQTTKEGAGASVKLTAALSAVSAKEIRVHLTPTGTAKRGEDWAVDNDTLVIPAGQQSVEKVVRILNNGVVELDEQVTFTMDSFTNVEQGSNLVHTVTIRDNDPEVGGVRDTVQDKLGGP